MQPQVFKDSPENPDHTARRQAWAYLNRVVEAPNPHVIFDLYDNEEGRADPIRTAERILRRDPGLSPDLFAATQARAHWFRPLEDLTSMARHGARLITPDDDEWPGARLGQSFSIARTGDSSAGEREDCIVPYALWVKGGRLDTLTEQAVTIVGTRASSPYGTRVATDFAMDAARSAYTVVSGGALGIDSCAHRGALAAHGQTVVVLACGIDMNYPSAHRELFDTIVEAGGALVTEYPPNTSPARHRFLTRNRLAAALSDATVVVEAAMRSGATNTVGWAEAMGKPVFAVPGRITDRTSAGCNRLLKENRAIVADGFEEIKQLITPLDTHQLQLELDMERQQELDEDGYQLDRTHSRVFDAIPKGGHNATYLAERAGLSVAQTVTILCDLRACGLVDRQGNRWERSISA